MLYHAVNKLNKLFTAYHVERTCWNNREQCCLLVMLYKVNNFFTVGSRTLFTPVQKGLSSRLSARMHVSATDNSTDENIWPLFNTYAKTELEIMDGQVTVMLSGLKFLIFFQA